MTLLQSKHNPQYQLSQQDLLDIDEEITQTYAPQAIEHQPTKLLQSKYNPQCNLQQQDLLDISAAITQTYAPQIILHESELVLLPVDPINLYAYWNLNAEVVGTLVLRVFSLPEYSEHPSNIKLRFDVKVEGMQNQQKVHLPIAAMAYSAVIGELNADGSINVLATADTIDVPRLCPATESHISARELPTKVSLDHELTADVQIEASIVHVPQESIVTEHRHEVNENVESIASYEIMPEDQLAPELIHVMREHPLADNFHSANDGLNQVSQAHGNEPSHDIPIEYEQAAVLIMQNFNDYGYDLRVYEYDGEASFTNMVHQQDSNIQGSRQIKAMAKNTSGLGFN